MTTTIPAPARRTGRPTRIAYAAVRVLFGLFGLFGLAAVAFFSLVADPADGGVSSAFDWFVAGWKAAVCLAFLVVSLAPGLGRSTRLGIARWAIAADLVFGVIKIVHYREMSAPAFAAIDAALLALVLLAGRRDPATRNQVLAPK